MRRAFTSDELYGAGHRPSIMRVGQYWRPACGCDRRCRRADDALPPRSFEDAQHDARTNLLAAQHGPSGLLEDCESEAC